MGLDQAVVSTHRVQSGNQGAYLVGNRTLASDYRTGFGYASRKTARKVQKVPKRVSQNQRMLW
jgi:hypothetical protein